MLIFESYHTVLARLTYPVSSEFKRLIRFFKSCALSTVLLSETAFSDFSKPLTSSKVQIYRRKDILNEIKEMWYSQIVLTKLAT